VPCDPDNVYLTSGASDGIMVKNSKIIQFDFSSKLLTADKGEGRRRALRTLDLRCTHRSSFAPLSLPDYAEAVGVW
jgi:hypothetical protein